MSIAHTKTFTSRAFYFALLALIALLPFHAFATTWAGSIFDNRTLLQSWKEILALIFASYTIFWAIRDRSLGRFLLNYQLNKVVLAYVGLHLLISAILQPELLANLHGLKIDLEFLVLFISAQAIVWRARPAHVDRVLSDIIIICGVIVSLFALAQATLLPKDFLTHFGYGPGTINPFLPIDGGSSLFRVLSTLGGPNQLGQYLILPLACVTFRALKTKKYSWLLLAIPIITSMYFTYSRGAWIGALLALAVIGVWHFGWRKAIIAMGIFLVGVSLATIIYLQNATKNSSFSYVVFHGSSPTKSVSNNDHIKALQTATQTVIARPLGRGTGLAGPASYYLKNQVGLISENYYLQVAIEVGIMGLLFFLIILAMTGLALARLAPTDSLGIALLATLIGWSFINLVSHGWADSTASLVWWGSAGAIIRKTK